MIEVKEHTSEKYSPRTYFNAKSADVTIAIAADLTTAGERLTHKAAGDRYIGFSLSERPLHISVELYKFMKEKNAKTLNIAGNGMYTLHKHGYNQQYVNEFVCDVIKKVNQYWVIEKIYTGGQTGVDLAGAVVTKYLNIPALITLPKGYIQRFEDKIDRVHTKEEIDRQIDYWCDQLKF